MDFFKKINKKIQLNSGRVVALGPGAKDKEGKSIPIQFKEGDTVLLPEYGGTQVKLGEKEYVHQALFLVWLIKLFLGFYWRFFIHGKP